MQLLFLIEGFGCQIYRKTQRAKCQILSFYVTAPPDSVGLEPTSQMRNGLLLPSPAIPAILGGCQGSRFSRRCDNVRLKVVVIPTQSRGRRIYGAVLLYLSGICFVNRFFPQLVNGKGAAGAIRPENPEPRTAIRYYPLISFEEGSHTATVFLKYE